MNQADIQSTVLKMQEEFTKVAQKCAAAEVERDAAIKRAERAESALATSAVTKVASGEVFHTKVAALAGRLVATGILSSENESEFVGRISADPSELLGVCVKLAEHGGQSGIPGAYPDPDSPADLSGEGRDPIQRFMDRG